MSIFGPGIANCLIAGGPQLGAGAAVGTGLAVAGIGAVGVGLAGAGVGAISTAGGLAAGAARGGASLAGAATTAYRGGGMSGMAEAAASSAGSAVDLHDLVAGGEGPTETLDLAPCLTYRRLDRLWSRRPPATHHRAPHQRRDRQRC